jgi:hypothetical protein
MARLGPSARVTNEVLIPTLSALGNVFEEKRRALFPLASDVHSLGRRLDAAVNQDAAQLEAALRELPPDSGLRPTLEAMLGRLQKGGLYPPHAFLLVTGMEAADQRVFKSPDLDESLYKGYQDTFVQALQVAQSMRAVEEAHGRLPELPRPGHAPPAARPAAQRPGPQPQGQRLGLGQQASRGAGTELTRSKKQRSTLSTVYSELLLPLPSLLRA